MLNFIRKDLTLAINPFFYVLPLLLGPLLLIPQWPYLIAPMYFFFISMPNLFSSFNAQRDMEFSSILPIRKKDIVRGRIVSILIIQGMHLFWIILFGTLHILLWGKSNFFIDLGIPFYGITLLMFSLFNLIYFPLYFKTAYRYGVPLIFGLLGIFLFSGLMEYLNFTNPGFRFLLERESIYSPLYAVAVIAISLGLSVLMNIGAVLLSQRRFERIGL